MRRRDFLRTAGGAAGAASVAAAHGATGSALAQEDEDSVEEGPRGGEQSEEELGEAGDGEDGGEDGGDEGSDLPGAGETQEITVGPGGDLVFEPDEAYVLPGTTVRWVWDSDNHNIALESGPDGGWQGYDETQDTGFEYEHTFEVEGTYEYVCEPHAASGMEATLHVTEDVPEDGGGHEEVDPAHMGIPIQKHFVGIMSFLGIFMSLVFTFYLLKYGESAHTSAPSKER